MKTFFSSIVFFSKLRHYYHAHKVISYISTVKITTVTHTAQVTSMERVNCTIWDLLNWKQALSNDCKITRYACNNLNTHRMDCDYNHYVNCLSKALLKPVLLLGWIFAPHVSGKFSCDSRKYVFICVR